MVPAELKRLPQWVTWRLEERNGKPTKVPYRPDGGGLAAVNEPASWGTARQAYDLWQSNGYSGIGFVLTETDPYVGLDLDNCVIVGDQVADWAQAVVDRFGSYTEVTPSGNGLRIWVRGKLGGDRRRKGSIEIYDHLRYFTLTGRNLPGTPEAIEDRQAELDAFCAELFPPAPPAAESATSSRLSDFEVLDLARKASNGAKVDQLLRGSTAGYQSGSEADLALVSLLAFYTQDSGQLERLWRGSALWREKAERQDYREKTIAKALAELADVYSPGDPGGEIRYSTPPPPPAATRQSKEQKRAETASSAMHEVYTAAELEGKDIPRPRSVIPGIINVGLNMLAGKGKLGKSWIALDTALAVALGGKALGSVDVDRNEVLYLALEDNQRRLQDRIKQLLGNTRFPAMLHIAHRWPKLDEGGIEALDNWLTTHPGASFVIVDVWKRIRHKRAANANLYDEDYEHLVGLQATAIKHDVAVLVVHHTRKAVAEDVFDEINGSGGVLAALDSCIILHRSRSEADGEIWVTGRDIEEAHLALRFEGGRWTLLGSAAEASKSKERRAVLETLHQAHGQPMTPAEVASLIGKSREAVKGLMWKMASDGELRPSLNGSYLAAPAGSVTRSPLVTPPDPPQNDRPPTGHPVTANAQILSFPGLSSDSSNTNPPPPVTAVTDNRDDRVTGEELEKEGGHPVTAGLSAHAPAREEEALPTSSVREGTADDVPGWPPGPPGSGRVPSPPRKDS